MSMIIELITRLTFIICFAFLILPWPIDAPTRADMAKLNERGNRNSRLFTEKTMTMADWFCAPNSPERNLRPSLAHSSKQKMRRPLKAN